MNLLESIKAAKAADDPDLLAAAYPYGRFLGLRTKRFEDSFVCHLPFDKKLIGNPVLPALHGGVVGALLENAALLLLLWELETDRLPKTINLSIDYLRSAGPKDTYAKGYLTKQGRRVANVRVEAWQDDQNRLVAAAHGHFLLS